MNQDGSRLFNQTKKRSLSQGAFGTIDLTDDDEVVRKKKPKLTEKTQKNLLQLVEPTTSQALAVHVKKVEELRNWLKNYERIRKNRSNPMLLVTGPCGSGKLTAVKILASEQGFDTFEYATPFDTEIEAYTRYGEPEYTVKTNQKDHLLRFLRKTSRFGSIFGNANPKPKLLIVKDFPNILIESPTVFEEILQ